MKKIMLLLFSALLIVLVSCKSESVLEETLPDVENNNSEIISETASVLETQEEIEVIEENEPEEQLITYYDKDSTINLYLNRFNSSNPDQIIDENLFSVYHHHGQDHYDQIKFYRDDFEVVISSNSWNSSIKLVIDGGKNITNDDYKIIFFQYARAYNAELTDEMLETYWQAVMDDIIHNAEFDEFDCALTMYSEKIEYMVIEGAIS